MDGLRQAEPTSKRRIWVYARTARVNCGEQANLLHTHSARIAVPVRLILDIVRLLHQTKVVRTKIGCKAAATRSESTELYWQYSPQASPVLSLHHMRAELLRIYFIATTQNTDCIVWFCIGQSGGAGGEWSGDRVENFAVPASRGTVPINHPSHLIATSSWDGRFKIHSITFKYFGFGEFKKTTRLKKLNCPFLPLAQNMTDSC